MSSKRYEYKIIDPKLWAQRELTEVEEHLNRLGQEGWEIVGLAASDLTNDLGVLCLAKRKIKTRPKHDE